MSPASPDVVVIGGGPAGLSAAIWCADLGCRCVVIEARGVAGGQLHEIPHPMRNLPGSPDANAAALARSLASQALSLGVELTLGAAAQLESDRVRVHAGGTTFDPRAVVIATGVRRRRLRVPGEDALLGAGVHHNVGEDLTRYRGARVVVIGGGDDALVHATLLAPVARSVIVVHRRAHVTARLALAEAARRDPRIAWLPRSTVTSFEGAPGLRAVHLATPEGPLRWEADRAFVCAGPEPNSDGFGVARAPDGAIVVDRLQRTSRANVFAVGDVCCSEAPTVSTALGHGAIAAKVIAGGVARGGLRPQGGTRGEDRLRVRGLRLPARVGAYASERAMTQMLRFDLDFPVDARGAAITDRLEHTLDYATAAAVISEVLGRRHYALIESVADAVADALLDRFDVREVVVEVTKPGVPQAESEACVTARRVREG